MRQRVHIVVSGRVQGVGFRYHTQRTAMALGLTGYVRNLPDGGLEIVAEGAPDNLRDLAAWARHGPRTAYVADMRTAFCEATGEFADFAVRP